MNNKVTNIVLCGANGQMGRAILKTAAETPEFSVSAGVNSKDQIVDGINVYSSFNKIPPSTPIDMLVDFSHPSSLDDLLPYALTYKKPLVIGTAEHTPEQIKMIEKASQRIAIFKADNFRKGMRDFIDIAAFMAVDWNGEIKIEETHNEHKKGTPSGTSKLLAQRIASARKIKEGGILKEIPIKPIRIPGKDFISQHTVYFAGDNGNSYSMTDCITDRSAIATDVLDVCRHMQNKKPKGIYNLDSFYERIKD